MQSFKAQLAEWSEYQVEKSARLSQVGDRRSLTSQAGGLTPRTPNLGVSHVQLGRMSWPRFKSLAVKPTTFPNYVKKNQYRRSYRPYHGDVIKSRPKYFTSDWLDADLVVYKKEILNYVGFMNEMLTDYEKDMTSQKASCIIRIKDKICPLSVAINYTNLPPSTATVQWRQSYTLRQPTMLLLYMLLTRFGTVVGLIKTGPNKAIVVYENISQVERAIQHVSENQSKRLLIVTWWYPHLQSLSERKKIHEDSRTAINWALKQHNGGPHLTPIPIKIRQGKVKKCPSLPQMTTSEKKTKCARITVDGDKSYRKMKKSDSSIALSGEVCRMTHLSESSCS